jgi:hypothetical protein
MNVAQTYWHRRRRHSRPVAQTTTTALSGVTADINTFGKYRGKLVCELETLTVYEAQGAAAGDTWRPVGVFDASGDVVPV